ncbi:MAG: hypothetical protein D6753_12640 [Planctomycetota bacterium]|nr:MAG: hypothetical protein D6753_12640 [Planctomycetota bacterium]
MAFGNHAWAQHGSQTCCMCGKKVCVLSVKQEKEEVTCFDVEAKEICIPGIKLPWECKRRCGGVRTVCVLKEVSQERTVCHYDWSIRVICTSCCRRHGLKHGPNCAEVQRDQRVPFEYYTAELAASEVVAASAQTPQFSSPDSPAMASDQTTSRASRTVPQQSSGRHVQPAPPLRLP